MSGAARVLVRGGSGAAGCPEAPRPEFAAYRAAFLDAVAAFAGR